MIKVSFHLVDVESPQYGNVCDLCGSLVASRSAHEKWHVKVGF